MNIMELYIGQEIYIQPTWNAARYNKDMKTDVITKVGRKYFETERSGRFFIETMLHDNGQYVSGGKAFVSIEDYNICVRTPVIRKEIIESIQRADWDTLLKIKTLLS